MKQCTPKGQVEREVLDGLIEETSHLLGRLPRVTLLRRATVPLVGEEPIASSH